MVASCRAMLIDPRARCLPCSRFKTNHSTPFWSHSCRLPTSRLRSLPPRREGRCRGHHGGRVVVKVRRLASEEEALLERMGQIFPRRSMPGKRMAVGYSHMVRSAPARGDKRTQAAASRPIRIGCKLIGCVREAGCSTQSRITGGTTSFPAGVASFQRSHRISSERSCICLRRWQRRLSVGRQRRSEVLLISAPFSVELPFLRVIRRRRKIPPARDEGPRGISRGCDFHHGGSTTF
jgi:hypothetical protein